MGRLAKKQETLTRRKLRVRGKVSGSEERPRLCVSRSLCHLRVQVINDVEGRTLAAASTQEKTIMGDLFGHANIEAAKLVGKAIAERALAAGVTKVVFDRSGRPYHGRIKALADAAREAGLQF